MLTARQYRNRPSKRVILSIGSRREGNACDLQVSCEIGHGFEPVPYISPRKPIRIPPRDRSGTERSNPSPSSRESASRRILPSHGEKPAFRAGVRARQVQRGQQRRVSVHGADRREYLCRAKFQYRGVDEAVA